MPVNPRWNKKRRRSMGEEDTFVQARVAERETLAEKARQGKQGRILRVLVFAVFLRGFNGASTARITQDFVRRKTVAFLEQFPARFE